jgi:hypothetical protein
MAVYFREVNYQFILRQPFNAGIKSHRATLPDEIFTGDFAS